MIAAAIVPSRSAIATDVCSTETLTVASISTTTGGVGEGVRSGNVQLASAKIVRMATDSLYREITSNLFDAPMPPRNVMYVSRRLDCTRRMTMRA